MINSTVAQGTYFKGCNFSDASMTEMKTKADSPYSPNFVDCDFSKCKLINAHVQDSRFSDCNFSEADFSDAEIGSAIFSSCNLSELKFNDDTDTKGIELLGKDDGTGFNQEWDDLKMNKDLVAYLLSKVDVGFRQKILKDNLGLNFSST